MAYSYTTYTGNGSTTQFAVSFGYIRREHVAVTVAGSAATFTWVNNSLIQTDAAPANGAAVLVYRTTPLSAPLVDFADGATLVAADLDTNARQSIYTQQELDDALVDALANVIPNGDKGDITTSVGGSVWTIDNGAVVEAKIGTGAVTEAKIGTGAVTETKLGTGAVTESKLGTGAVTSAKIADDTIVNADVNASAGIVATKLAFTQSGTGATARTVDSKLKEVVSVKDFGAVGDGTTDDTAAFNAALSASASMNVIYVPPGNTYRITSTLNITGNKSIVGLDSGSQNFQAAFIYHDPASTGPLFNVTSSSNGVCIKNLTVTGGNGSFCIVSSNSYVRYEYVKMQSYAGSGIQLLSTGVGSSSSKLINCSWQGPGSATNYKGFEINVNGGDVHLKGCTAIHGAIGIDVIQGQTIIIDGCSVNKQSRYSNFSSASQFNTAGIKLSGTAYKQAISIKNSYIEGCDNGIYVEACESLSIEDNLMYDSGVAGVVGAWTAYGNSSIYLKDTNVKNVTIKNNSITALSNGNVSNTFYALYVNNASNVVLSNNHLTTTGSYNAQLYVTTPVNAYVLANTQAQSGSNPQASYNPNNALLDLNPKLPAWVAPTFTNSWVNAGDAAYTKDHMNCVTLRSVISSGTMSTAAFTLPVGYRPVVQESFVVNSNAGLGIVTIFTNGAVTPVAGNNAYVYLSGIRFQAT